MTKRADFDGALQAEVLVRFRTQAGRSRTTVASLLGLDHDTYRRYETGRTELRVSQVTPFAHALGTTPRALAEALGLLNESAAPAWSLEAELRAAGMDVEHIQRGLDAGHGMAEADQRAFALGWIRAWRRSVAHAPGRGQRPA